jgi:hypothetical protein
MRNARNGFGVWLERLTTVAAVLMVAASLYRAFWTPFSTGLLSTFSQFQQVADVLRRESDPSQRDVLFGPERIEVDPRPIDARMPANARVFVLSLSGSENLGNIAHYCYLTYYLFPREVAISLGGPPTLHLHADTVGVRSPASLEELQQAGYDFAVKIDADRSVTVTQLGSLPPQSPETRPKPIPEGDGCIALLLPLAVAITGSRMVRWLFGDLQGILSTGELLASGLAVGAFFLTQINLGLRMAGARWERVSAIILMVWAAGEVVLLIRRCHAQRPQLQARHLWWLLLAPVALLLWCQFRLAGLLGLVDFDAVAIWAFKAKILHYCAGKEMWTWFTNPNLAYAHLDYPLLVPLLHALTYGALGHVNEFVTKFWNQWMLLLLAWAVLGAGQFPDQRPWLAGSVAAAIVLLPMSREFALMEGATIPMLFYAVLSSMQLAIGMLEQQAGRLRLGLLLLLALVMVKFEGMILLGLWGLVLLLDRDSRAALWPLRGVGWAGLLGVIAWLPYVVFRLHGPVAHPESGWVSLLITNASAVFHILPMTWVAMLACRFLNNDFALWSSPDNQHAAWQGHWLGWPSLVDPWTQGMGWVCVLLLVVAWCRGGRLRWTAFRLLLVFLVFATVVSLVWSAVQPSHMNYALALSGSLSLTGGRYLYPVLMAWFVAGVILLLRELPGETVAFNETGSAPHIVQPIVEPMT